MGSGATDRRKGCKKRESCQKTWKTETREETLEKTSHFFLIVWSSFFRVCQEEAGEEGVERV